MSQDQRQRFILREVDTKGNILVSEIVEKFSVSAMTARRDIGKLDRDRLVIRTHGGAVRSDGLTNLFTFSRRMDCAEEKKTAISQRAADFVNDHDTIFIDCGTTLFRMCHYISRRKGVKVITNSIAVATELIKYTELKGILIGGEIIPERRAVFGPTASRQILEYHMNTAFIGTEGISIKHGLTAYDNHESNITKAAAESADRVCLLCDSSKVEQDSFYKFLSLDHLNHMITDSDLHPSIVRRYQEHKVEIITVD
jgi:DeoR family transcriptional regulator, fructose operon transcriptional repressor